jgi:hypothetical protein
MFQADVISGYTYIDKYSRGRGVAVYSRTMSLYGFTDDFNKRFGLRAERHDVDGLDGRAD